MVDNFIVIQLIFADKFVSQDFIKREAPGLSGPANTCAPPFKHIIKETDIKINIFC